MNNMFLNCVNFNQPLDKWDVSSLEYTFFMFSGCTLFNQPLNTWETKSLTDTHNMFSYAISYNNDISDWNTSNVFDMEKMFYDASSFSQKLCWGLKENVNTQDVVVGTNGASVCTCNSNGKSIDCISEANGGDKENSRDIVLLGSVLGGVIFAVAIFVSLFMRYKHKKELSELEESLLDPSQRSDEFVLDLRGDYVTDEELERMYKDSERNNKDHLEGGCENLDKSSKFAVVDFKLGERDISLRDLLSHMGVMGAEKQTINAELHAKGEQYIIDEWKLYGNDEDRKNLDAILKGRPVGDCEGRSLDEILYRTPHIKDIVDDGSLTRCHILALRLYTSKSFWQINAPLRNQERSSFIATTFWITDAIKVLRRIYTAGKEEYKEGEDSQNIPSSRPRHPKLLWRGLKNMRLHRAFLKSGGTELACMSTSSDQNVAIQYASSDFPLLLRLHIGDVSVVGADIQFLSVFPKEKEYLFPPMTYLKAYGKTKREQITVKEGGKKVKRNYLIVDVAPKF